jgi:hypothetical protein
LTFPTYATSDMARTIGRTIATIANQTSREGCASHEDAGGGVIVLGRIYLVMYTDGRGQAQTERGQLVALDQEGFVVLEVNGKHLLVPKARIDALLEVE